MTRKNLTDAQKWRCLHHRKTLIQCALSGEFYPADEIEFDHIHQQAMDGRHEIDNFRPLWVWSHKIKTAQDARDRAKAKRLAAAREAHERGERKASRMKSRGFDKTKSKKFDGRVLPRNPASAATEEKVK